MPDSPGGGEKTQQPTPKRLEQARKEGQVAFSVDLTIAVLMLVGLSSLAAVGPPLMRGLAQAMRSSLGDRLGWELDRPGTLRLLLVDVLPAGMWTLALAGILFVVAAGMGLAQVGFQPTAKPLVPKLSRINPLSGLKRLFGMRGLMRFVFSFLKLVLIMWVAYLVLRRDIPAMAVIVPGVGERAVHDLGALWVLALKLAGVLAVLAFGDFLYQRYQHTRELMMTLQEVRDEMKQSEGDPHVKGKVRQIQRQMAQKRMMQEVPKADVVITNPTHVAVALTYDQAAMAAPVVVAKGYDDVAQRIKALAAEHGVPLVENVPLARALAKDAELGKPIPVKWYQGVAEVLAAVYRLRGRSQAPTG